MLIVRQSAWIQFGRLACVAVGLAVVSASAAPAQEWARKMFVESSHDFGALARGAKAEFRFTFQNIYEENVHIASVKSSCGCTTPKYPTQDLKTWEKGEIVAVVDTLAFTGHKEATLTVTLDKPFSAEVQLHVYCIIRSDVVVQPGVVQFGTVDQGTSARRQLTVSYAGRSDWRITNITSANEHLSAQLSEPIVNGNQVTYQLALILTDSAPAGDIQDHITIVTNDVDTRTASVPVAIEGAVVSALTVRPSPLMLGVVAPGQTVTRYLTVKGKAPFQITGVQCSEPAISVALPAESKPVHMLPVTFTAGTASGDVSCPLRITTSVPGAAPLEVTVQARVVAPQTTQPVDPDPADAQNATEVVSPPTTTVE